MDNKKMYKDLFSNQASLYVKYRPNYPNTLFEFINQQANSHKLAWDCAAGNGQASCMLADYFDRVLATDLSEKQISNATPHDKVEYRVASSYESGLADSSVDCIAVAQALHWFDNDHFYNEVKRVAKADAILAVWGYDLPRCIDENIHQIVRNFYNNILKDHWDDARKHVDSHYQSIYFPFKKVDRKNFTSEKFWDRENFLGYLSTWSAVQSYQREHHKDPIKQIFEPAIKEAWSNGSSKKKFIIDIFLLLTRVNANSKPSS